MDFKNNLFLAPMAGFTDVAFRQLCQEKGAGLTFTEMISVNALSRANNATLKLLEFSKNEIVGVQLFGQDPELFIAAIKVIEKFEQENNFKFAVIDINFGCPASKIIKQGSGSALMSRPNKVKQIVETVVSVAKRPVFCKIRSGIDKNSINAVEIAKICEGAGASLLTIHSRTQKQGYSGKADWSLIKEVKDALKIPVCGNGDVTSYDDYLKLKEQTNVDYVMIGRGAIGNPFIFQEIELNKNLKISSQQKIDMLLEYIDKAQILDINFNQIKIQAQNFIKGIPNSSKIRNKMSRIHGLNGLYKILKEIS